MQTETHPALACVQCEIRALDGRPIRSFIVDHNTAEGRKKTAIAAREAMIAGHQFISVRQDLAALRR